MSKKKISATEVVNIWLSLPETFTSKINIKSKFRKQNILAILRYWGLIKPISKTGETIIYKKVPLEMLPPRLRATVKTKITKLSKTSFYAYNSTRHIQHQINPLQA